MSVLKTKNKDEIVVNCNCGCGDGIHFTFDKDRNMYCFITYFNSKYYQERYSMFNVLVKKLNKIWKIIRSKDICYSDIIFTKEQFEEFKKFINQQ